MSDKQQDKRLQQQCWRQQSALPIAGADFAGDDEDEDDDMLPGGGDQGDSSGDQGSYRETRQRRITP